MLRAGRLRHKVAIEKAAETRGVAGGVVKGWTTYAIRGAAIEPLSGKEYFQAQQEQTEVTVKILIRYDSIVSGISPSDYRVKFNSVIYDITAVINPMQRNREIELMCRVHNGG